MHTTTKGHVMYEDLCACCGQPAQPVMTRKARGYTAQDLRANYCTCKHQYFTADWLADKYRDEQADIAQEREWLAQLQLAEVAKAVA